MKTLLTVCIGNICRSPMAQGLLASRLPGVNVKSAGVGALVGERADNNAIDIMARRGIDLNAHVARQINHSICSNSDLILVMDMNQRKFIEESFPLVKGRVFLLLDNPAQNVPDPYQRGSEAFDLAFRLIEQGVDRWVMRIDKLLGKSAT